MAVLLGFQMIVKQLLCRILRERERVDQLQNSLLFFQLSVLVAALLEHGNDLCRRFQNLSQPRGVFGLKIDLCHRLFDVGQAEGDVFIDGHIGPECIILEQEADPALVSRDVDAEVAVKDNGVANGNAAARRRFQTCDHAQRRGLAAAGRAEQRHKRIVRDHKVQILNGIEFAPALGDMFKFDFRHGFILRFLCRGLRP